MKNKKKRTISYLVLTFSLVVLLIIVVFRYRDLAQYLNPTLLYKGVTEKVAEREVEQQEASVVKSTTSDMPQSTIGVTVSEPEDVVSTDSQQADNEIVNMSTTLPQEEATTKEPEEIRTRNIQLAFVGDILLSDGIVSNYDQKGLDGILSKNIQAVLSNADLAIGNEEFPFSSRGVMAKNKQFTFRINPKRVGILSQMGMDVMTIANNHALDFGQEALMDTFTTLNQAGITYIGAGKNLDRAKEIQYKTVDGLKLALLGASRVIPVAGWNATSKSPGMLTTYDPTILLAQIAEAETKADYTVVYIHWGIERKEWPEDYQRSLAKQYIDAGADLVIGSHPHCLQGIEYYQGKPIIYSLGNFLFGETINRTAVLKVTVDKQKKSNLSILPCVGADYFISDITNKTKTLQFYQYLASISYDVTIGADGTVKPNQ